MHSVSIIYREDDSFLDQPDYAVGWIADVDQYVGRLQIRHETPAETIVEPYHGKAKLP